MYRYTTKTHRTQKVWGLLWLAPIKDCLYCLYFVHVPDYLCVYIIARCAYNCYREFLIWLAGCQIILSKELEGITLTLPRATRNFYVDGHIPKPH